MSCSGRDLTIEEALTDPVIRAAMRADRVDPHGFEVLLRSTARRLDRERPDRYGPGLAGMARAAAQCRAAAGAIASW